VARALPDYRHPAGLGRPTLDSSLTNEQRALLAAAVLGVRCDSAARETNTLQFPQSGRSGASTS
jgi:hypothetical protein